MDYMIITAGGKGLRMGSEIPKQFLPVRGIPVLMRTISRFREYSKSLHIILVLPKVQQEYWKKLCEKYHFDVDYQLAEGGETRFHSVQNGLQFIPDDACGIVGVHDGVRPFPTLEVISRCMEAARTFGAAIPVIPVIETLRYIPGDRNVMRSDYRLVQTPQCFDIQLLKRANKQSYDEHFTDDASIVEAIGQKVIMVEGNRENIKITAPFDMRKAEVLASSK